jgi:hypothetical protein
MNNELKQLKDWILIAQPDSVSDILHKIDSLLDGESLEAPNVIYAPLKKEGVKIVAKRFFEAFEDARSK